MSGSIPWNSQPLNEWASQYAEGKFIELGGRSTHYIEKGEGDPIILLHGFNFDSYTWATNLDVLAEKFKVYALDLWGLGYSTREALDYGYPLYVEQVLMFMDHLGIQSTSLIGHSMGGGTAIKFSVLHRAKVMRVVLVGATGIPTSLPLTAKLFQLPGVAEFLLGLNTNAIRRKNLSDFWITNRELITDDYFDRATRFQKIEGTTESLLKILRKEFFHTLKDEIHRLGQMDVPIQIIWGREDNTVPLRYGEAMHRILKNSRMEVLDHAGHLANFDQSDVFNQLVIEFLLEQKVN
jgi:pimeloyl-ACP methyl ester carboxylesterase